MSGDRSMSTARFSIVIPSHDRPAPLHEALCAIAALDYPRERFEVIVVADGAGAVPEAVLAPLRSTLEVLLVQAPHGGPAAARNAGAARAVNPYLVFTDDDCRPAANWLQAIAARITPESAVGGVSVNALPENIYASASEALLRYLFDYYNREPGHARFLSTNNLAVPAARFQAIGGFAPGFRQAGGEDREFCARWREQGYALLFAPEIVVYHAHALRLPGFWQQHFNYGRGAFRFRRLGGRRPFEPLSFYTRLLRSPFAHERGVRAWRIAALLLLAQCATAAGFAFEFLRRSK